MSKPALEVFEDALALSEDDRARLAERLVASLDAGADVDAAEAWTVEIERRVAAIEAGQMSSISMPDALARLHRAARGQ